MPQNEISIAHNTSASALTANQQITISTNQQMVSAANDFAEVFDQAVPEGTKFALIVEI